MKSTAEQKQDSHKKYWEDIYSDKVIFTDSNLGNSTTIPWDIKTYDKNIKPILDSYNIIKGDVLELGCGAGHDSNYFSSLGFDVTAIDVSNTIIESARSQYKNINFICSDFRIYKPNKKFDLVFIRGSTILQTSLKEINGLDTLMLHLSSMLNEAGKVIFLTGNYNETLVATSKPVSIYLNDIERTSLQFFNIKYVKEIIMEQNKEYGDSLGWAILMQKKKENI